MALGEWWSQVSGTVLHGLEVTVIGMLLVFFTLGLVILAMVLLTKLPWLQPRQAPQEPEAETSTANPTAPSVVEPAPSTPTQTDELAQVAAITVALLRSRRRSAHRVRTRRTRGSWRNYGRAHQLGME